MGLKEDNLLFGYFGFKMQVKRISAATATSAISGGVKLSVVGAVGLSRPSLAAYYSIKN